MLDEACGVQEEVFVSNLEFSEHVESMAMDDLMDKMHVEDKDSVIRSLKEEVARLKNLSGLHCADLLRKNNGHFCVLVTGLPPNVVQKLWKRNCRFFDAIASNAKRSRQMELEDPGLKSTASTAVSVGNDEDDVDDDNDFNDDDDELFEGNGKRVQRARSKAEAVA